MAEEIVPVDASDTDALDAVVALIAAQQQRRDRLVVYVGEEAAGIRAELDELSPPWAETVRVHRDASGAVVACALTEWDESIGRAWVHGPWIDGDDAPWTRWSRPLVEALLVQLPPTIHSHEMSGTVENTRLGALAADLGWPPTEVNFAYVLDGTAVTDDPHPDADGQLRGVVADDLGLIAPLHELEFPNTYFSARQLVERAATGEHVVLVATTTDGHFAGYAAGRVQPDGIGYIDFVAVEPDARGAGAGRRLVDGLVRRLLPDAPKAEVHLTVQEHRAPARALYTALGFRLDIGFVGYRSPPS
jgi:ribosomal protein S18 acetylase RimI-like enzyme